MGASLKENKISSLCCAGLLVVGTAFQWLWGDIDNHLLAYPWSLVIALFMSYGVVLLQGAMARRPHLQTYLGRPMGTALLAGLILLSVIMGLSNAHLQHSWPMALLLIALTIVEGVAAVDDILHLHHRPFGALLSHLGVYLFLVAAICGNADRERATVSAVLDAPINMGVAADSRSVQLPFAIELKKFSVDEYPPKLCVYNTRSHLASDQTFAISNKDSIGRIDKWHIAVTTLLPDAMPDSVGVFQPLLHVGATPAACLHVTDDMGVTVADGWVCSGSFIFEPMLLSLNDSLSIWMQPNDARQYTSDFTLSPHGKDKPPVSLSTSVNHPARWGKWKIYQTGYETERGKWSSYSVLECVCDPWSPLEQIGLWILLAGGVMMVIGRKTSGRRYRLLPLACVFLALLFAAFSLARPQFMGRSLVPALRSVWFIPHVTAYMFAYSLVSIGLVMAIARMARGQKFNLMLTGMGWGLLSMGMVMGALWAKQAWGDYWTWDPKETWAAATWASYLVCLHLPAKMNRKLLLVGLVVSFLLLQMTWYGLNFLPSAGGLHTY